MSESEIFISYSQTWEDVMLHRALRHVSNGFYIDVGAWHPVYDSVTKAFYDKGWHGINLEPAPRYYEMLKVERPRDINLKVAAWTETGEQSFFVSEWGLSTIDHEQAKRHSETGFVLLETKCQTRKLGDLIEEHAVKEVHFLKIDTENSEMQVLEGMDFSKVKPWIVLVESTIPCSPVETWSEWEPILLRNGYGFCYFDGLNRFYLSDEHDDLRPHFRVPPNPFDHFVPHKELRLRNELEDAERKLRENELALKNLMSHFGIKQS